jgi:hypothetical protein
MLHLLAAKIHAARRDTADIPSSQPLTSPPSQNHIKSAKVEEVPAA